MEPLDLVKKYINQANIMQLATSLDDEPWACNIHFYADNDLNIFWLSAKDRRHSEHIALNPNAAVAIKIKEDTADDKDVVGISISGKAECIEDEVEESIAENFTRKHKKPSDYVDGALNRTAPHRFYRLTPTKIVLFDTKNFPDDPRQEITL